MVKMSEEYKDPFEHRKKLGLGPTGEFPQGQMGPSDKGELAVAMAVNKEKEVILIDFGTSLSWLGMRLEEAKAFSDALLANIKKLEE